jgi:hypothetical protein
MKAAILKNGVFGVIEAPEKIDHDPRFIGLKKQYEEDLARAIGETFVPFEDQTAWNFFTVSEDLEPIEGKLYPIPDGWEVEIKEVLSSGWVPSYNDPDNIGCAENAEIITVAILKKKEEVKEETQEELWKDIENGIIIYHNQFPQVREEVKSQFTITRNK